jgi:YkoP domain
MTSPLAALGCAGVRVIDLTLKRYYRVFEFTDDPACILRAAPSVSARDIVLSDGVRVARGEPILELHFWNERLPALPHGGASLAWGIEITQRGRHSLHLLAAYLACEPRFNRVRVLHGESGFLELSQFPEMRALVEHWGFDFMEGETPGWRVWNFAFWQNLFSWWLMWTYNPSSLHGKHFHEIGRSELWMSRSTLMKEFGERATHIEGWRTQ